jgi:hypothetical protein
VARPIRHQPPTQTLEYLLGADPAVLRGFARAIEDKLSSGHLTLAERDRLISRGERLGLKRFDANLVLATMEHRRRERGAMRIGTDVDHDTIRLPRWLKWATVATLQITIAGTVLWLVL